MFTFIKRVYKQNSITINITIVYLSIGLTWLVVTHQVYKKITLSTLEDIPYIIVSTLIIFWLVSRYIKQMQKTEELLIQSKNLSENLIKNANIIIVGIDLNGNIKIFNKTAELITGYRNKEVIGKNWFEIFMPKEKYPKIWTTFNNYIKNNQKLEIFENPILTKFGKECCIAWRNSEIIEQEKVAGIISFGIDITEQKKTEKYFKESEEKYRTLAEAANDMIFVIDKNHNIKYVNIFAAKQLCRKPEEIINKPIKEFYPEHIYTRYKQNLQKVFDTGNPIYVESPTQFIDIDKDAWLGTWLTPIKNNNIEVDSVMGISRDLTVQKIAEKLIIENEEKYRNLVSQSKDAIFKVKSDGSIEYASPACLEIFGYTAEEFISNPKLTERILHPDYYPKFAKFWEDYLSTKTFPKEPSEWAWIHKNKNIVYAENVFSNIYDSNGTIIGFQTIARNITQRKITEQALLIEQAKFRSLVEQNLVGICTIQDGVFQYVNPKFSELFGYTSEELIFKKGPLDLVCEEYYDFVKENFRKRERGELQNIQYIFRGKRKNGSTFDIEIHAINTFYNNKMVVIATLLDITERKKAEETLKSTEAKFRGLVEQNLAGIYIIQDNKFQYVNPKLAKLHGYTPEEIIGKKSPLDLTYEDDHQTVIDNIRKRMENKTTSTHYSFKGKRKDGSLFEIESYGTKAEFNGKPAIIGISLDITNRKLTEKRLKESEEKYRRLVELSPDAIAVHSEGKIVYVNKATIKLLGAEKPEQLIGKSVIEVVHPDYRKIVKNRIQQMTNKKLDVPLIEEKFIKLDGTIIDVEVAAIPFTFEGKSAVQAVIRDITERKQVLEQLNKAYYALEQSPNIVMMTDINSKIEYLNPEFTQITGYTIEEAVGKDPHLLLKSEKILDLEYKNLMETILAGKVWRGEFHNIKKNGDYYWESASISAIKNSQGKITHFLKVAEDITEQKHKEEEITFLSNAVRMSGEGIVLADMNADFTFVNDQILKMYGPDSTKEELIGRNAFDIIIPQQKEEAYRVMAQVLQTGFMPNKVYNVYIKDGSILPIEMSITVIKDNTGTPTSFIGICRDITPRLQAEEKLRESEERYRSLFETSKDCAFISAMNGEIIDMNSSGIEMFGYTKEELHKIKTPALYMNPEDRNLFVSLIENNGFIKDYPFDLKRKDGTAINTLCTVVHKQDKDGNIIRYQGIVKDITQQKKAEHEKLLLEQQLHQSQKIDAIGQLAAGIAHDINNALLPIIGYADLILVEKKLPKKIKQDIKIILQQGKHASELIKQILDFSRSTVTTRSPLDVPSLVKKTVKLLRRTMQNISIDLVIDNKEHIINANPTQIQQIITNLAVNSRDAMPDGGKLTITVSQFNLKNKEQSPLSKMKLGEYVTISVKDSGTGISAEIMPKIFEPFFTTKESGKGIGLGLSQVYGIVKQNEGYLEVKSKLEHGTNFIIYLPSLQFPQEKLPDDEQFIINRNMNKTILLVEDKATALKISKEMLEVLGCNVITANNGESAIKIYKNNKNNISYVLSDMVMPKISGADLYYELKKINPAVKIIITSGYPKGEKEKKLLTEGVLDWLQKPFTLYELENILKKLDKDK